MAQPARLREAHVPDGAERTLITGAAGFIGAHLVARRLERGDTVSVIVRQTTDLGRLLPFLGRITVHALALTDRPAVDAAIAAAQPDTVFHLAASDLREALPDLEDARLSIADDLCGFINLVAACAAAPMPPRVMVRASSLAEYGPGADPYVESQKESPQSAYAAGLVAATCYARMLAPRLPFALASARLALLYGPGQSDRFFLPSLIANCIGGRRTTLQRPFDRRDMMYIDDAIAGLEAMAAKPTPGLVNLSTGHSPTMIEVAALVLAMTGAHPDLLQLGPREVMGGAPLFRGCAKLARTELGWSAQVPLQAGLERTIDWYRRNAPQESKVA